MDIRPLPPLSLDAMQRFIIGYTSLWRYAIRKTESDQTTLFVVELERLETPYIKHYDSLDAETGQRYRALCDNGLSLGAYDGDDLIGLALAEQQDWNNSVWVWEFHVAESHRGQGGGTQLMEALAQKARAAGLRAIFCETQTTNVPAIRFYRKLGFTLDGFNLSFYSNDDWPQGEVAVFMKRTL